GTALPKDSAAYCLLAKPLLRPRIAAHVVAAVGPFFPEAGLVVGHQLDGADPLGAFPSVKPRDDEPPGKTVVGFQVLAVVLPGEQAIVAEKVSKRQVRREAMLAVDHDEFRGRKHRDLAQHVARADAFPEIVELAPARDAVHVGAHRNMRQGAELVVAAFPWLFDEAEDVKRPARGIEARRAAVVQDGPFTRQRLARRDTLGALDIGADNYGIGN